MAEFALGLTKTAVEGTLSRVKSAIEEEARLKEKVHHDLVFITAEFQMMQSFLNVANKERAKNEVVRTWVRQLRDLAFDVEDCVEFVVHLDNKSTWWWRMVPSCVVPQRHRQLDEAAAEIKLLKARVEDVSQRNTCYNLISDSGSHTKTITVQVEQQASATANPPSASSAFPLLWEVWEAAGRIRNIHSLQDLMTAESSSDLKVISVWGNTRGDLGSTSILRKAYHDKKFRKEFRAYVWIKLMHPFNRDEFLKSFMIQLCSSSHQVTIGMENFRTRMKAAATVVTEDDLIKAEQLMKENRYLVVLEDVSTLVEWDAMKMYMPDYKNGSRIVMSTQDFGVALMCTGEPYEVSELRRFSHGQSICAFSRTVSSRRRRDFCELVRLIERGGVISVHGNTESPLELIERLFNNIVSACEEYDEYFHLKWANVSNLLERMNFPRRLSTAMKQNDSRGLQANKFDDAAVDQSIIEDFCKTLREENSLVVIDGLQSTQDWDRIKAIFLSQSIKGCILVIANEEHVAKHCVDDEEDRVINCEYLVATSLRLEEAREWIEKFELVGHEGYKELSLSHRVVAVWGIAGVGKSAFVRKFYYDKLLATRHPAVLVVARYPTGDPFLRYSWVDVPHPFNLTELSWRLLLDLASDDLAYREVAAVSIIEDQDPIQQCRILLRERNCLVVLDGLQSNNEWDLIKSAFLSGASPGITIVIITNEANVARYCVDYKHDCVVNIKCLGADEALYLFKKVCLPSTVKWNRFVRDLGGVGMVWRE